MTSAQRPKANVSETPTLTEKEQLNKTILDLRAELFTLRDELQAMRNSRVLGKIIKTREVIGDPHTLPHRSVNKVRRTVAKFIPDAIRLPLMKNLRRARDAARSGSASYRSKSISVVTVKNTLLPKGAPLVSVVIPYYNRADTIDDTLHSLTRQTFTNFETIIIDDGSPDKLSIDKLKDIAKKNPHIRIISQKNQGVAATRNNGIEQAKAPYIVCLDSDDMLEPTYLEKAATILETNPDVSIVTAYMNVFGVMIDEVQHAQFDPLKLYRDNMIITAAMFRKGAWAASGGYKSNIGYEDWEFWINLVELGYQAITIPEQLFRYRTSMQSRYVEDKGVHWNTMRTIRSLHPDYKKKVKAGLGENRSIRHVIDQETAFINLEPHIGVQKAKANVMVTIPWMTFGGAETLIYNFARELKDDYNITFVTGLKSENEWEYKFKEISENIYHLANLFTTPDLYLDYVSRLITLNKIDTLHIIHNGFTFEMLAELKTRHPKLRVILTLFNDRAAYFDQSLEYSTLIDTYTSDNGSVINHFKKELGENHDFRVIPNGIDSTNDFNPALHDRDELRAEFELDNDEVAVFYVGRFSEEKNPDVFLDAAAEIIHNQPKVSKVRFFMIGDGPMRAVIEKQVASISSTRITYLGYQSAIAHYLSAADIFVLPSAIEGFPLSILEAMAMRVVVIASNVGAVSEVITSGKDGFVVTPGSAKEIVEAIKKLATDKKLLATMKKLSRAEVEAKYSNIILGKNYRRLYDEK